MDAPPPPTPKVSNAPPAKAVDTLIAWYDFLTSPGDDTPRRVTGAAQVEHTVVNGWYIRKVEVPTLRMFCATPRQCEGERLFDGSSSTIRSVNGWSSYHLVYKCRNCSRQEKVFCVLLRPTPEQTAFVEAIKLAEWPFYADKVPDRALELVGEDRGLFLQGRKAENRGLGIGALAYYRRVVENQRTLIIDEILKVAKAVNASSVVLEKLEKARTAWRFEQSIEAIKDAIPESLKVVGQNPLVLLHDALSDGLHDRSDEECLTRARAIRTVLSELGRRIQDLLMERTELKSAVSELLKLQEKE